MATQEAFQRYLKEVRELSDATIRKTTVQAHNRILTDLGVSYYALDNSEELHRLYLDVKQLEKEMPKNPNRMYSSAVSHYMKFFASQIEIENMAPENSFMQEIENVEPPKIVPGYVAKPQPRSGLVHGSTRQYKRNPATARNALAIANYSCEINSTHRFFISKSTNQNYVEAHHLIPISFQSVYENGIDTLENIISLCPACHRQIHHAHLSDKKALLDKLFRKREGLLNVAGIDIKNKELLEFYG